MKHEAETTAASDRQTRLIAIVHQEMDFKGGVDHSVFSSGKTLCAYRNEEY
jgi:hypothetical protein